MKITYTDDTGNVQNYDLHVGRLKRSEVSELETRYGGSLTQWHMDVMDGGGHAEAVALYMAMRKNHPAYKWQDLPDYEVDALQIEGDQTDYRRLLKLVDNSKGGDKTKQAEIREALQAALDEAVAAEGEPSEGKS